jgi:hypothetical protein
VLVRDRETNTEADGTRSVNPACPAEPKASNRFKSP